MSDDDGATPPVKPDSRAHGSSEVVALAVLAGALGLFALVALAGALPTRLSPASITVAWLSALAGPTLALVVTRAQVRRRATDLSTLNLDAYVGTGIVVALLAFPSLADGVAPGPVGVMCLGFVAVGVLRREVYLAAAALAAFLASGAADLMGPLRADGLAGAAQVGVLVVTAAAVAGLAAWRTRTGARPVSTEVLAVSEPA